MKWIKMSLKTTVDAEDLVSCTLAELGVEGIEIEDKVPLTEEEKARMFIDILPELGEDDGEAVVSFYLDPDIDVEAKLSEIHAALDELREFTDIGEATIQVSETEDKDWINNWKEFFKPFRVDDRIWIKPTWESMPDTHSNDLVIEIDPGTAFGTGSHETTRLCILNMKERMKKGDSVLDVGCGSGILSIIAKKIGSGYTIGVDVDENAVKISQENAEVNQLPARSDVTEPEHYNSSWEKNPEVIDFITGNLIASRELREKVGLERYDLVVANILADIIIPLSAVIGECMKKDAVFISSGIIKEKESAVTKALCANGFQIVDVTRMGDWVSIVCIKK